MHRYLVFGLTLRSARALPGIEASAADVAGASESVEISLGARPTWADTAVVARIHSSDERSENGSPVVTVERMGGGGVRFTYGEGIRFHVSPESDHVWSDWDPPLDASDAMTFLLGPVLGYVLRARGILALHASAVEIGGKLTAFVGPAGAGKSTMAASLASRGHAVLSDDVLAMRRTRDAWVAWPAHDQIRLWDESVALLFGTERQLPALTPTWEKRALGLRASGLRFSEVPRPLRGIVLLDGAAGAARTPVVRDDGGRGALLSLIGNTYVTYLLDGVARARELEAIADLASRTPIGRLLRPADGGDPSAVAEAIERWVRRITL